ncbi:MAG: hypothetical protein JNJ73_05215 [Hyphomonadaceae bacterium]|nr:hypothetical protein [Hyphomonadaceae bacterium]
MIRRAAIALLLACAPVAHAQALDTFLWPPAFERAEIGAVFLSLSSTAQFPRMEAGPEANRVASTNGLAVFDRHEEALRLALVAPQVGVNVAAVTMAPQDVEHRGEDAARYLDEVGASPMVRAIYAGQNNANLGQPRVLRETYTRYAKTIFCVANCLQLSRAVARTGQALEFVVFAGREGVTFRRFLLYRNGVPAGDHAVVAVNGNGERRRLRTNAQGLVELPEDMHGPALLTATVIKPPEGADTRFSSDVATLTFIAPPATARVLTTSPPPEPPPAQPPSVASVEP